MINSYVMISVLRAADCAVKEGLKCKGINLGEIKSDNVTKVESPKETKSDVDDEVTIRDKDSGDTGGTSEPKNEYSGYNVIKSMIMSELKHNGKALEKIMDAKKTELKGINIERIKKGVKARRAEFLKDGKTMPLLVSPTEGLTADEIIKISKIVDDSVKIRFKDRKKQEEVGTKAMLGVYKLPINEEAIDAIKPEGVTYKE